MAFCDQISCQDNCIVMVMASFLVQMKLDMNLEFQNLSPMMTNVISK